MSFPAVQDEYKASFDWSIFKGEGGEFTTTELGRKRMCRRKKREEVSE
jgi:hypothetical protein